MFDLYLNQFKQAIRKNVLGIIIVGGNTLHQKRELVFAVVQIIQHVIGQVLLAPYLVKLSQLASDVRSRLLGATVRRAKFMPTFVNQCRLFHGSPFIDALTRSCVFSALPAAA
ncbi:hypothetical protein HCH_03062 [Hahella chejuensis KCTC 2396]|uniref:Uncharacterized protein n=1 Tax=Hahella chejuensis (strain KCTC 2396) TaxID=349521 RepID=Q2SHP6_HAHCH|nr:hypothetical protein HCH_03062 [Hahella chejuensis KCTC 2396]